MRSKIILHIGLYKTATTFLQQRIFCDLDANAILPLSDEMRQLYDIFESVRCRNLTMLQGKECARAVIQGGLSTLSIVSNEELLGHDKNLFSDVAWRFQILEQLFDRPHYIITIRRQDSICVSSWYQGVKQKNFTHTFDEYVNTHRMNKEATFVNPNQDFLRDTDFRCYNYLQLLAPYLEHSGRVTILPVEMLDFQPSQFYRTLLSDFSVDDSQITQFVQLSQKARLNQSNTDHAALFLLNYASAKIFRYPINAAILRRLHKIYLALNTNYTKRNSWETPFVVAYLKTIGRLLLRTCSIFAPTATTRILPSPNTKQLILEHHRQSNRQLSEKIGIDLSKYGYY